MIWSNASRIGPSASSSIADSLKRGIAGGEEQLVALAQRRLHRLGQPQDHRAARPRPALLDVAHVSLGRARPQRQLELTHAARDAPPPELAREASRRRRDKHAHGQDRSPHRVARRFPGRYCRRRRHRVYRRRMHPDTAEVITRFNDVFHQHDPAPLRCVEGS